MTIPFSPERQGQDQANIINLQRMLDLLVQHEGLRLKPYRCTAGKLTIGVGRNLEDVGISEEEAMTLLANDISRVIEDLVMSIPAFTQLNEIRRRVLIDMGFNLGIAGLMKFRLMLAAIEEGNYRKAADEMLDSRWARQVGQRATRLANMMATGEKP